MFTYKSAFLVTEFVSSLAINESCLVYDGKLVVDSSFNTNDPRIRAAGPLTKYGRKYYAESW